MAELTVGLGERSYPIIIEQGCLDRVGETLIAMHVGNKYAVIADDYVASLYGDRLLKSLGQHGLSAQLFTFPRGESSKKLETLGALASQLAVARFDRSDCIVALGGGVTGDLAGYLASSYMRGIPFVQVPTTLLSQVDSSVGGKTGVDIAEGKNLLGAFYQPKAVFIDPEVLVTLEKDELLGGLAEVIKYGVIWDESFFSFLEKNRDSILSLDPTDIEKTIFRCCSIKADVVSQDEREGGVRRILNFGHTIGHAVEAESQFTLIHGLAISIGMVAAARLSAEKGLLDTAMLARIISILENYGMPTEIPAEYNRDNIKSYLKVDKKAVAGSVYFVLCDRIGNTIITDQVSELQLDAVLV